MIIAFCDKFDLDCSVAKNILIAILVDIAIVVLILATIFFLYVMIEIINFIGIEGTFVAIFCYMGFYYTPVIIIII